MNKTAIVTGASSGIGSATATALARDGYELMICGNSSPQELEKTKESCLLYTPKCISYLGDIRLPNTAKHITETALNAFGHIDVLINNAGISKIDLITDHSEEDWFRILNTNLSSAFFLCRQVIPSMIHEKSGKILQISSVWGERGASCEAAYSAAKGGLNTLTKALAKELAPSGISVNAIACGVIDTPMNANFSAAELHALCEEIPCGRMASADEVADFVCLLLHAPNYLTGQIIGFDGGWMV